MIFESSLPSGAVNVPYSATVHVTQGTGTQPFAFSIVSGSLPAGLTMNEGGKISGTPTTIGTFTFTVQVKDGNSLTGTKILSINIRGAVSIVAAALPGGTVGVPYSATVTATGGVLPYTWSVISGTLPAGLTLTSECGRYRHDFRHADDSSGPRPSPSRWPIRRARPPQERPPSLSIFIEGFLTITTTSLPTGYVSILYDTQLMVTGGTPPYQWTLSSGTLPPGLTLTPATGVISGTPTTTGSYPITVQVVDSEKSPATAIGVVHHHHRPDAAAPSHDQFACQRRPKAFTTTARWPRQAEFRPTHGALTAGSLPAGLTLSGTRCDLGLNQYHGQLPHHGASDRHSVQHGLGRLDADRCGWSVGDYHHRPAGGHGIGTL